MHSNLARILGTVAAVLMTCEHYAFATMSVPDHFNITVTFKHGNITKYELYNKEGAFFDLNADKPRELPWNITGVTFTDTYFPVNSTCDHYFAVCCEFPSRGPTALIFHPEFQNHLNLSSDSPLDTRFASHVEVRDRKVDDPAKLCDTAYDTSATPNGFVLNTFSRQTKSSRLNHGMVFRKPALYPVPKMFSQIDEIELQNYENATYTIYFCVDNPQTPVFSVKASPYNFTAVAQLKDITAIDIVPESLELVREPCFGERRRR